MPTAAKPTPSWREFLPIHPAAEMFPLMAPDELRALGEDIKKNGLTSPIVLWQGDHGSPLYLLDGRNRLDAIEPGIDGPDLAPNKVIALAKSVDPYAYVISANIHRRHLTADQRRELIAKLIKATPEKSDRQIAKTVKASPTTIGTVRANMEAKGEVSKLDTRTDAKGIKQPARARPKDKRRERISKLQGLSDAAAAKERKRRPAADWEKWDETATAEAGALATKLIALDRDIAIALNRFLQEGGESRFMEALDEALRPTSEGNGLDPGQAAEKRKQEFAAMDAAAPADKLKRGRGRPKGPKNKPKPPTDDGLDIPTSLRRTAS